MAIDFSKLNIFARLNARTRLLVLVGGIILVIAIIYLGTRYLTGGGAAGVSRVATAPRGLQSTPGGTQTAEFAKAQEQANVQRYQQAQMGTGSAIPTFEKLGNEQPQGNCVICTEQTANVKYNLDEWSRKGTISPDLASTLQQLADRNVPVDEYAAELDRLVREGKLTPEQARQLLEQYKKMHGNKLLQESANAMDALIKSGQLPLDVANALLLAQKNGISPCDYASLLQDIVKDGKITSDTSQQLLSQYTQQNAREMKLQGISLLHQMARGGQLTPDVEKDLVDLETRTVPFNTFNAAIQKYLTAGKITPVVAKKVLDDFMKQKMGGCPIDVLNQKLQQALKEAEEEIAQLLKTGAISQEVAAALRNMIQKNVAISEFQAALNQFVQQRKMTPEIAARKLADYQRIRDIRDIAQRLAELQGNNASPANYADALKAAVQAGILTPEEAAQLLQNYQALLGGGVVAQGAPPSTEEFAKLQQKVQQGAAAPAAGAQFAAAQAQVQGETAQDRRARLDALMNAMSGQAQQLVNAWQPPTMLHKEGAGEEKKAPQTKGGKPTATQTGGATSSTTTPAGTPGAPLIKAGTIYFAVLDTAVNSDYPDSPVLATIVDGKYKGGKLVGKLTVTKNVAGGQMDRVALNFTIMNMEDWDVSKSVQAYAIDPDTARSVMASSVNYHYLMRFGSIMATSFLQGYATSITNAGTSTTGIFGTSTTHPSLVPGNKIAVGLGQMGQTLGAVTQNYINTPPTVRVDSGVGLGILFINDVT